jgi:predicted RNase H-like HicB family nuclease
MVYTILLNWDNEARVWIAESDDIPGLILESPSVDTLIEHVQDAVPELLELSGKKSQDVELCIKAERRLIAA